MGFVVVVRGRDRQQRMGWSRNVDVSGATKIDLYLWSGYHDSKYCFPVEGGTGQGDVTELHAFTIRIFGKENEGQGCQ